MQWKRKAQKRFATGVATRRNQFSSTAFAMACAISAAHAQESTNKPTRLDEVVVHGREDSLVGVAESATQGTVGAKQLADPPIMRSGEILETVPGVIITQHAGGGKANQYFLRGFNLDHALTSIHRSMTCR